MQAGDNESHSSNGQPAGAQKLVNAIGASLSNLKLSLPKRDPKQKPPEPPSKQDVQRTPPQGPVYDETENSTESPSHSMGNNIANHAAAAAKVMAILKELCITKTDISHCFTKRRLG